MELDEFLVEGANLERLLKEYRQHGSLSIGYDFDGTVHDFHKTGAKHELVRQLIRDLKSIGCIVICWTAYKDHSYVKDFLIEHNIPCDGINEGGIDLGYESRKPFFSELLDDRAGLIQSFKDLTKLIEIVREDILEAEKS